MLVRDLCLRGEPSHDFIAHRGGHGAIVHGHQHSGAFLVAADSERLGEEVLLDAFAQFTAIAVAAQPHGVIGRDVDLGDSDEAERRGLVCGAKRQEAGEHAAANRKSDDGFHRMFWGEVDDNNPLNPCRLVHRQICRVENGERVRPRTPFLAPSPKTASATRLPKGQ